MAFDGIDYPAGSFVYPYASYPGAPVTDDALATTLQNAYFAGRYAGRRIFAQTYPYTFRTPATLVSSGGFVMTRSALTRLAEGYARAPLLATHLRAAVVFTAQPTAQAKAYHGIVAYDGTTTATGDNAERPVPAVESIVTVAGPGGIYSRAEADLATEQFHNSMLVAECEVALATLDLTQVLNIYVQGYAVEGASYATAVAYKPLHICVFAEVRG